LRDSRDVPWNRSKIMLVGQGGAGKTALANKMMGKDFEDDSKSTIGAKKFERKLTSGKMRKGEKGAILEEYVSSPKELESFMAMAASRRMGMFNLDRIMGMFNIENSDNGDHSSPRNAEGESTGSSIPIALNVSDVDTATFNKCLSENIARKDQGSELIISLYDFGGQDIFNVLHHFFMSKFGVYIVVFDMELFLSKDEEKRESCMKHLKFWMNSIVMHTYDEKSGKTAPVALVGTRGDLISTSEEHNSISMTLEKSFYCSAAWNSLIVNYFEHSNQRAELINTENGLSFFPVDNKQFSSPSVSVTPLLDACLGLLEDADFVKKPVSFIWLKILDEVKSKGLSFLSRKEVEHIATVYSMSVQDVPEMLAFFYEMGMVMWIDEGKLRDIVILDPIKYFVKPATMIICKHIATKDDSYHIVHCEEIHQDCRRKWPEDWFQMLEFGLVSQRLARRLLLSACEDDDRVDKVLLLMERFGFVSVLPVRPSCSADCKALFVAAVSPSLPEGYYIERKLCPSYGLFTKHERLIESLRRKRTACSNKFHCVTFQFAFSTTIEALHRSLLSTVGVTRDGFLPNGLFERLIGRLCGVLVSAVLNVREFLDENNFIAFKDVVKLKYCSRSIRLTNLLANNMIQVDYEVSPKSNSENENQSLMFVHDFLYEMIQEIIRECKMNLVVVTLLPVDSERFHCSDNLLLPLSKLIALNKGKLLSVDFTTADGDGHLFVQVDELRHAFGIWLGVSTIHPKENEYTNKVPFLFVSFFLFSLLFLFYRSLLNDILFFFLTIGD
jgi:GTPase SAR1 family protein